MDQLLDFDTLEAFINHLKSKKDIIGIVQYGSRDYTNMSPGGDYDLNKVNTVNFDDPSAIKKKQARLRQRATAA